ncbi:MAG: glycoside hydrolase family 3 N-terminal domain-containing protein, partial [bacterium]|nr:glycoside hydrolase family 3 N-terminal domain-containing protein [bacterium]
MKKDIVICIGGIFFLTIIISIMIVFFGKEDQVVVQKMNAMILANNEEKITVMDQKHGIYTFHYPCKGINGGTYIVIEYSGLLDKNKEIQENKILNCERMVFSQSENEIPSNWLDDGIFSDYYAFAYNKLQQLSLDQKIGQLLLARYPDSDAISALETYQLGGYVFYAKDFTGKTELDVQEWIQSLQDSVTIPLLTAVDEEGGKVVRVSTNPKLVAEPFLSSQTLYHNGGLSLIREDTQKKSGVLKKLGLNLNLAPVVDVSTNSSDYIYERSLGLGSSET